MASSCRPGRYRSGSDLKYYDHKVYITNGPPPDCTWSGFSGYNSNWAWIFGYNNSTIIAHELGHNFGARHAQWLKCGTQQVSDYSLCTLDEYGDPSSVMGYNWSHYNHF